MNHEHTIGVWQGNDYAECVSLNELAKKQKDRYDIMCWYDSEFATDMSKEKLEESYKCSLEECNEEWKKYFDWRCLTDLIRFTHCPFCGETLNWSEMKKSGWISVDEADSGDYTSMYGKVKKND